MVMCVEMLLGILTSAVNLLSVSVFTFTASEVIMTSQVWVKEQGQTRTIIFEPLKPLIFPTLKLPPSDFFLSISWEFLDFMCRLESASVVADLRKYRRAYRKEENNTNNNNNLAFYSSGHLKLLCFRGLSVVPPGHGTGFLAVLWFWTQSNISTTATGH